MFSGLDYSRRLNNLGWKLNNHNIADEKLYCNIVLRKIRLKEEKSGFAIGLYEYRLGQPIETT